MRRLVSALAVFAILVSGACARESRDDQELRRFLRRSELAARSFTYAVSSAQTAYTVSGSILDDFKYQMTLSSGGTEIIEQVVSDDARAVRLPNAALLNEATELGHQSVDEALRSGRWVVDPSGAPPLVRTATGAQEGPTQPFQEALTVIGFVRQAMADAFEVKEFNFEAIDYKPSQDPWEYPRRSRGEVRYDMARRFLPKTEDQIGGAQGDIIPGHFRKLSAYVRDGRVYQICSLVDIEGHEDFIELKEAGPGKGNPFHRTLLERIRKGDTQLPIFEIEHYVTMSYPETVDISLPQDAHIGNLDGFELFENEGLAELLDPPGRRRPDLEACDRPANVEKPAD